MRNRDERLQKENKFGKWLRKQRGSPDQQWLADKLGVKRHTISEYETGDKIPSPIRLARIASLFHADIPELSEMTGRKVIDIQKCFDNVVNHQLSIQEFKKQAYVEINSTNVLREVGDNKDAIDILDSWISEIEDRISLNQDNLKDLRELKLIAAKGYVERLACKSEMQYIGSVIGEMTGDFGKAVNYSVESGNQSTLGWANSWFAGGQYVALNYSASITYAKKALLYCPGDPSLRAETLRVLYLDYAYLKQYDLAQKTEEEALKDLDTGVISSPKDRAGLWEGISRGHAILAKEGAIHRLDSAKEEMTILEGQKQVKPIRNLQILRSELIMMGEFMRRGLSIDRQLATEIANRGLLLSDQFGYLRYQREFRLLPRKLGLQLSPKI